MPFFLQMQGQFARTGRFALALQAHHHNDRRRRGAHIERSALAAHDFDQLVMDDLDDHLSRLDALEHLAPEGGFLHIRNELLNDLIIKDGIPTG